MPNVKALKAIKKLMQERGLLKQVKENLAKNVIDKDSLERSLQKIDPLSIDRTSILRQEGRYDPRAGNWTSAEKDWKGASTNEMINMRGGQEYTDPRRSAYETQKGSREHFEPQEGSVYEGWPEKIVDDKLQIIDDKLSLASGADAYAAKHLRAVKNYPSKDWEENQLFRGLVDHYKRYPNDSFQNVLDESPELWNRVLESKTTDKFNKIKEQLKKKKSE